MTKTTEGLQPSKTNEASIESPVLKNAKRDKRSN